MPNDDDKIACCPAAVWRITFATYSRAVRHIIYYITIIIVYKSCWYSYTKCMATT